MDRIGARSRLSANSEPHLTISQPTPINYSDLPSLPEIWEEIFLYCTGSQHLHLSNIHRQRGILPLTWVCSYWRHIALSSPRLWSRIHAYINQEKYNRRDEALAKLVDLWMERSMPCGLTVVLSDLQYGRGDATPISNIPSRILSESHRWEFLYLNISAAGGSLERFASLDGKLQSLKYLSIIPTQRSRLDLGPFTHRPQFKPFEQSPQLQGLSLMIGDTFFSSSTSFNALKYLNLMPDRFVHGYAIAIQDCLRALVMCPNLVGIRLNCGSIDESRPLPDNVTHLNLRTLEVFWTEFTLSSEIRMFLGLIDLPVLLNLSMTTPRMDPSFTSFWDHDAMKGFLIRQRGTLEALSLDLPNMHIGLKEFVQYLHQLPNIQRVDFTLKRDPEMRIEDETLRKLLVDRDGRNLAISRRLYCWYPTDHLLSISSFARSKSPAASSSISVLTFGNEI